MKFGCRLDKNKKYHYTYCTTNLINGKLYYGVHSTDDLNDGYIGSGNLISRAKKKYGVKNFSVQILNFHDSFDAARKAERVLVNEQVVLDKNTYNLKVGGEGGTTAGIPRPEHVKIKISLAQKGKPKHPGFSEICRKVQTGKTQSEETKKARKESLLKHPNGYNRNRPSHRRNPEVWDNIDRIKDIWIENDKPGSAKLQKILVGLGFPNQSYGKILQVLKGSRVLLK